MPTRCASWAALRRWRCSSARRADPLTTEALILGQGLGVDSGHLSSLFITRGIYLSSVGRRPEAVAYYREAARLAEECGRIARLGIALFDLSEALTVVNPAAAEETARTAAGHLREIGDRFLLACAITSLAQALVMLGDWDTAEKELAQAAEADGLADIEMLACCRGWLAALRGDIEAAETTLVSLPDMRASDDAEDRARVFLAEAFTAAARCRPRDALRSARTALGQVGVVGSAGGLCWEWPLAARTAYDLSDDVASRELLDLLDDCPPGHLAPVQRAERDLVRARLTVSDGGHASHGPFAAAVDSLRKLSTPYHLAHGLLDYAQYLARLGQTEAAEVATGEASDIARRLRCRPLVDRAAELARDRPGTKPRTMLK
jgi:tetratricopeptide (TPR) repeat protein